MKPQYLPGESFDAYMRRTNSRYVELATREEGLKDQEPLGGSKPSNQVTKLLVPEEKNTCAREADLLIERYGDVIGVIDNHKLFEIVTRPINQGGWGIYPQALTRAVKAHSPSGDLSEGLERLILTARYIKAQRNARNPAKLFWYVLANGMGHKNR